MDAVAEALATLTGPLLPLREAAVRLVVHPSRVSDRRVVQVGHRPWVAKQNYALSICPPASHVDLKAFAVAKGVEIPDSYLEVLSIANGCFCFGLALYGAPESMLREPRLLDRKHLQCLDVSAANKAWAATYSPEPGWFHFGGRALTGTVNCGYFLASDGTVVSISGKRKRIAEWPNFADFLREEVVLAERLDHELGEGFAR